MFEIDTIRRQVLLNSTIADQKTPWICYINGGPTYETEVDV